MTAGIAALAGFGADRAGLDAATTAVCEELNSLFARRDADWSVRQAGSLFTSGRTRTCPPHQGRHATIMLDLHAPHRGPALCLNASRAAITALELGVPAQTIREGISGYRGVSRRMELRHNRNGVCSTTTPTTPPRSPSWPARCAATTPAAD